jgi:hypothetical protein
VAAVKVALRDGQEATTCDDWSDYMTYSYHDYRRIILDTGFPGRNYSNTGRDTSHRWVIWRLT